MALIKADRVKETTTTTGIGSFTLSGAVAGYRSFSDVCSTDDTCFYTAINSATNEWECGIGTFISPNTLERTRIKSSSGGGKVDFDSGIKEIFISVTATQIEVGELYSGSLTSNVYMHSGSIRPLSSRIYAASANILIGINPFTNASVTAVTSGNIAIGTSSLYRLGSSSTVTTSSGFNVAIGQTSGGSVYSGLRNIFIGYSSGYVGTATEYNITDCVLIGSGTITSGTSESNCIVIGANATGNGSNTTTIGHTTITDCYIRGNLHPSGAVRPASIADASAPTNALYFSTDANKLVYKDSGGTVNNLY